MRLVMAALVAALHVFDSIDLKTWMPGTRPGMTVVQLFKRFLIPFDLAA
jgi:hypothetical protein